MRVFQKIKRQIRDFWREKFGHHWPAGCGYQGYEFGAGYMDSQCYGGRMFDMDAGDDGLIYEPMEHIPCPICHRNDAILYWALRNSTTDDEPGVMAYTCAVLLVDDIRKNRGLEIVEEEPHRSFSFKIEFHSPVHDEWSEPFNTYQAALDHAQADGRPFSIATVRQVKERA